MVNELYQIKQYFLYMNNMHEIFKIKRTIIKYVIPEYMVITKKTLIEKARSYINWI